MDGSGYEIPSLPVTSLQGMLGYPDVLVVDVRTDTEFKRAHLAGAVPLPLPAVLWRRFLKKCKNTGSLDEFLICDNVLKTRAEAALVVVYDEATRNILALDATDPLRVICEYFAMEGLQVCYVEGGFAEARATAPSMVASSANDDTPSVASPSPISRKRGAPTSELTFIYNFLAVGSEQNANDISLLRGDGITHVLNLTNTNCHPEVQKNFKWMQIGLKDTLTENILAHLKDTIAFIEDARRSRGRILVHCKAGISRSVAVAIAYVMWFQRMPLNSAMDFVQSHRECASPNLNFVGQLMMFSKTLSEGAKAKIVCEPLAIVS